MNKISSGIVRLSYIKLIKRLYITSGEFLTSYLFQTGTKEIDESDREYLVCDNFFKLHITRLYYGWTYLVEKSWIRICHFVSQNRQTLLDCENTPWFLSWFAFLILWSQLFFSYSEMWSEFLAATVIATASHLLK